jgi:hypothetical protein
VFLLSEIFGTRLKISLSLNSFIEITLQAGAGLKCVFERTAGSARLFRQTTK